MSYKCKYNQFVLDKCRFVLVEAIRTEGLDSILAGTNSLHNRHLVTNAKSQTVNVVIQTQQEEYRWC